MDLESQELLTKENRAGRSPPFLNRFMKWAPLISLCIGLCAFMFQIFVLFPWHLELSREFAKLARQIKA